MKTYLQQHKDDVVRITERSEKEDITGKYALQAGAFRATASFFARMADHEAANHQRMMRDPNDLVAGYINARKLDKAEPETIIAELLYAIAAAALGDKELSFERAGLCDVARELGAVAERRTRRREEDLDAPAAARADDEYSRKVDDGLIGRSEFLPEAA